MLPDPAAALAAELEGPDPAWDDPPEPPPDPDRANELLARLARLEREEVADRELAVRQLAQVNGWLARRNEVRSGRRAWLSQALALYAEALYRRQGVKTLSLPAGELVSRQEPPSWVWDDEAAFIAWAETNLPAAIRRPPLEIDKAQAKHGLTQRDEKGRPLLYGATAEGEKPPGLTVTAGGRSFTAKPRLAEEEAE